MVYRKVVLVAAFTISLGPEADAACAAEGDQPKGERLALYFISHQPVHRLSGRLIAYAVRQL